MLDSKKTEKLILIAVVIVIVFSLVLVCFPNMFSSVSPNEAPDYQSVVFENEANDIIKIDITVDENDWNEMQENKMSKPYISCDMVIDGKEYKKVGIRPKGNSSLTSISGERISFRVDFDRYIDNQSLYGLEQIVLNNFQADATYMKDYVAYDLMEYMGVKAPLRKHAYITINGEPFGVYLAVEVYDEDYALRTFEDANTRFYSVKSSGLDTFEVAEIDHVSGNVVESMGIQQASGMGGPGAPPSGPPPRGMDGQMMPPPPMGSMPEVNSEEDNKDVPSLQSPENISGKEFDAVPENAPDDILEDNKEMPEDMTGAEQPSENNDNARPAFPKGIGDFSQGMGKPPSPPPGTFGGGGDLVYTDDSTSSYSNIFANAVSNTASASDFAKVIRAIYYLNKEEVTKQELETYWDVDGALRYLAVHAFMVNGDSYTGNMMQNFYLSEHNGRITILPWDYNLSFGAFGGGGPGGPGGMQRGNSTLDVINHSIDEPTIGVNMEDRPLVSVLLGIEEYKQRYYQYLEELTVYASGDFITKLEIVENNIYPYIANQSVYFYSAEDNVEAFEALKKILKHRSDSILTQIGKKDAPVTVEALDYTIDDLGTMHGGGGPGGGMPQPPEMGGDNGAMPSPTFGMGESGGAMMAPMSPPPGMGGMPEPSENMRGGMSGGMPPPPPGMQMQQADVQIDAVTIIISVVLVLLIVASAFLAVVIFKREY